MKLIIVYLLGGLVTFIGGQYLIKKGWWKESGSHDQYGPLSWKAWSFDALFIAIWWPVTLIALGMIGTISPMISLEGGFLKRTK